MSTFHTCQCHYTTGDLHESSQWAVNMGHLYENTGREGGREGRREGGRGRERVCPHSTHAI